MTQSEIKAHLLQPRSIVMFSSPTPPVSKTRAPRGRSSGPRGFDTAEVGGGDFDMNPSLTLASALVLQNVGV